MALAGSETGSHHARMLFSALGDGMDGRLIPHLLYFACCIGLSFSFDELQYYHHREHHAYYESQYSILRFPSPSQTSLSTSSLDSFRTAMQHDVNSLQCAP
jgi:hypothetical protein